MMQFRHEVKHEIGYSDMLVIQHRLGAVAQPCSHAIDGVNRIRSLYFDDLYDKALMEKVNGMSRREKFRIRYYNGITDVILLSSEASSSA